MTNTAQSPGIKIPQDMNNSITSKGDAVTPDSSASFFASNGNDSQTAQQLNLNLNACKGSDGTNNHVHQLLNNGIKRMSHMVGIKL